MKKLIITVALLLSLGLNAQIKKEGKELSKVKTEKSSKESVHIDTGYTWKDSKGKVYIIYQGLRGGYYILKVNKEGKEYKQYLPKEVKEQIESL